jgi:hypothetical protein
MGLLEPRPDIEIAFAIDATGFAVGVFDDLDSEVPGEREIGLAVLASQIAAMRPLARPCTLAAQPLFDRSGRGHAGGKLNRWPRRRQVGASR